MKIEKWRLAALCAVCAAWITFNIHIQRRAWRDDLSRPTAVARWSAAFERETKDFIEKAQGAFNFIFQNENVSKSGGAP